MTAPAVTRLAPGYYELRDDELAVIVSRLDHLPTSGPRWVARAEWTRDLYTDPLWTLADAKREAAAMIRDERAVR